VAYILTSIWFVWERCVLMTMQYTYRLWKMYKQNQMTLYDMVTIYIHGNSLEVNWKNAGKDLVNRFHLHKIIYL